MKKSNLFLQTAIASAILVCATSQAGVVTGTAVYATENFGNAVSSTAITPPATTYTFNSPGGIVLNGGGVIYLYFRLASGTFAATPAGTPSGTVIGAVGTALQASGLLLSADSTTLRVTLTNGNANSNNYTIGVGNTFIYTGAASTVAGLNSVLATVGGTAAIQASASISGGTTVPSTGTALPADLDNGLSASFNYASSRAGITSALVASSSFSTPETQKIDLLATTPASRFTTGVSTNSTTVANLGSIVFTNVASTFGLNGTTAYTLSANGVATGLSGTVTGLFKTGSTATLTTDPACTAVIAAGSAGVLNAGLTAFAFTGGTLPTTAVVNYVCLTTPATTAVIPATTPAGAFSVAKTISTESASVASGNLLALATNGQTYEVRSYVPLSVPGYTSFVRMINSGNIAGVVVSGQFINADGSLGTVFPLTTLAAGGSITMSSTDIQAIMGAPVGGSSARPRLRLTAPTNGFSVQSQLSNNASGVFTDFNGAQ